MTQIVTLFDYGTIADEQTRTALVQAAADGKALLKRSGRDIWEMGKLLTAAKELLPHGAFGNWINAEFELTDRHARNFMSVYAAFKSEIISDLNISPTTLYLLAAPAVDEEVRTKVIEKIQTGEVSKVNEVRTILDAHIPEKEPRRNPIQKTAQRITYDESDALSQMRRVREREKALPKVRGERREWIHISLPENIIDNLRAIAKELDRPLEDYAATILLNHLGAA